MKIVRSLAAAALATAAVVATAAPASASSLMCRYETSTRLLTADDRNYRVWIQDEDDKTGRVCFRFGSDVAGSLIVSEPYVGDQPNVTVERDFGAYCPDIFDVEDPVVVLLEAGLFVGRTLCVGVAGEAYAINVSFANIDYPYAYLDFDRGTPLARTYCDVFPQSFGCDVDYAEIYIGLP